jgi:hypothetical protein
MRPFARRWREQRGIARRDYDIARAIEAARAPTVEAELRAIASTRWNR